jgi:hypothetical protein
LILFSERPLARTLAEFSAHYHGERNHQGKSNKLILSSLAINPNQAATHLCVASGSVAYSNTMAAPHEYFDLAGINFSAVEHEFVAA